MLVRGCGGGEEEVTGVVEGVEVTEEGWTAAGTAREEDEEESAVGRKGEVDALAKCCTVNEDKDDNGGG